MLNKLPGAAINHPPRQMRKPVLRLPQQLDSLTLRTRQINNVLIRMKKRQPKLVRRHQRRPADLTGLQRQRITVTIPMVDGVSLSTPQIEQDAAMRRMGNMPIRPQKILFVTNALTPLRLLAQLAETAHLLDLKKNALARTFLSSLNSGINIPFRNYRLPFGHLINGFTPWRTIWSVKRRPVGFLDIRQTILVHVEHRRTNLNTNPVPRAKVLVNPNFHLLEQRPKRLAQSPNQKCHRHKRRRDRKAHDPLQSHASHTSGFSKPHSNTSSASGP